MSPTAARPASAAAARASAGRFSAMEAATTPGTPVAAEAVPKAESVGHHRDRSSPARGKSSTSTAASNPPSSTAVKHASSRGRSPQMKVW